jgi:hypothetical protein
MKNLILLIFLSIISNNTKCKGIKKGVFISIDKNLGKTTIQRNDTIQLEENKKLGTLFLQKVKWLSDCEYIIYDTKSLIDEAGLNMSKSTFRVTFKESKNNIYDISVLVEPDNFRLDMSLEKTRDKVDDDFYDIIKKYSNKEQ